RKDHPGRAEAALQAVLRPERFLDGVELPVGSDPFDRCHRRPVGLRRQARARLDGDAVEQHGAGAALARVAANLGAGQIKRVAQEVNEQEPRLDRAIIAATVHGDADGKFHWPPSQGYAWVMRRKGKGEAYLRESANCNAVRRSRRYAACLLERRRRAAPMRSSSSTRQVRRGTFSSSRSS